MTAAGDRHARQRILPQIGDAGQERLRAGHAVIVGVGALGTHLAETLCRAGVGRLTLIDRDVVEWSNLQRQTLLTEDDARQGAPKADAAARALGQIDADARVEPIVDDLTADSARRLTPWLFDQERGAGAAVLLDGTDNFSTRFLLNDIAVATGTPMVYAGVVGVTGLMTPILPHPLSLRERGPGGEGRHASISLRERGPGGEGRHASISPRERDDVSGGGDRAWAPTPCLRCLFEAPPAPGSAPTCETAGVLGPAVSIIAGLQAVEALKILLGRFDAVTRALIEVNAWLGTLRRIDTDRARRPDCPCCAHGRFEHLDAAGPEGSAVTLCGADAVQITPASTGPIDLRALAGRLAPLGDARVNEHLIRARLTEPGVEITVFTTGRAIIHGVTDPARARALYARYVGT